MKTRGAHLPIRAANRLTVGVVGATGYTGQELIRILSRHPRLRIALVTSNRLAGKKLSDCIPSLSGLCDLTLSSPDEARRGRVDVLFLGLGHGEAVEFLKGYPYLSSTRVIDLSADFRFRDPDLYRKTYGGTVPGSLNGKFVYGLTEVFRKAIRRARYVANPGCYVTSVLLPLYPILSRKAVSVSGPIIVTSASGVSGAGVTPKAETQFCEVDEDYSAYKPLREHRHLPEMEEVLSPFGVRILFTPHLLPIRNGILSDIVFRISNPSADVVDRIYRAWNRFYRGSVFVHPVRHLVHVSEVRGTNDARFTARYDPLTRTVLILSAIDNLIKGASGQAVQNLNVMMGWPEHLGWANRS